MAEKMCNTINQNIDPYTGKLIINYFKQFGTLLNPNISTLDRNDLSQITINQNAVAQDDTNISVPDYSDPDTEFHEIIEEAYVDPHLVYDRGKIMNRQPCGTPEDLVCLRRLENTVTSLETFLEALPQRDSSIVSLSSQRLSMICPSPPLDDTLSDVDLDKFDTTKASSNANRSVSVNGAMADKAEIASLSDFHNVRDVLLNIRERLESYLKVNQEGATDPENVSSGNLEGNIAVLKGELEQYVNILNEKKENELRKFSENMINQSNILQMKKAFLRKEKLQTNIYETLTPKYAKYAIANQESLPSTLQFKDRLRSQGGFTMRNCYDSDYTFQTYSDFSSVEYYTMMINEEKGETLLNDAPQPRYHDREKISLIFRDPENVIKQWQNYQLKTIAIKPKKGKSLKLKWKRGFKPKPHDVWGFTLDYHQNRVLQLKLERERRIRLIFRMLFYTLSVVFFVLIVYLTQSVFIANKRDSLD